MFLSNKGRKSRDSFTNKRYRKAFPEIEKNPSNRKLQSVRILTKILQTTKNLQAERNSINIKESAVVPGTNTLHPKP